MTRLPPPAGVAQGSEDLLAFLMTKRWFGDKARAIRSVAVRDSVHVEWPNSDKPFSVVRADIETDAGRSTYQLFIERGTAQVHDALEDEAFRRGLIDAFVANLSFGGGDAGVRWRFRSESRSTLVVPPSAVIRLSTAEQSNSSVIVDAQAILKLFRKLEPGIHPDVEVTRFLTIDRQFVHVPVLLGTIVFEDAHGTTVAGMLQELVPGATDAWSYALQTLRAFFEGGERRRRATSADERGTQPPLPMIEDAEQLGSITRALHETLASGDRGSDFEQRPVDDSDLRAWLHQTTQMIERATTSLRRAIATGSVPPSALEMARKVAAASAGFAGRLSRDVESVGHDRGAKTRTHGDYHLGQVIRSSTGQFLVIDFEGEPARPLSERRAHRSPLRDVAGMLRSFAYAAAVAAAESSGDEERGGTHDWEQRVRESFLRGYFRDPGEGGRGILPSTRANAERLLKVFEIEKIFYELQYELDHRPEWVWIPLTGIAKLTT